MPTDVKALKQDLTRRMEGAMETLKKEFSGLRTGRASPALWTMPMVATRPAFTSTSVTAAALPAAGLLYTR